MREVYACIYAMQLLTRLPMPLSVPYDESTSRRSLVYFPAAGAIIGLLLAGSLRLLSALLPETTAAVFLLLFWVVLTGALHLDGLMDTADGIFSHRPREQMLSIMKDSRVGSMGVAAGVMVLLLKAALLLDLHRLETVPIAAILVTVPIWSRSFLVWAITAWPYAGNSQGMGSGFRTAGWKEAIWNTVVSLVLTGICFVWLAPQYWLYGWGLGMVAYLAGRMAAGRWSRLLGGLTGDTYGALNEGLEIVLLTASLLVWRG